MSRFRVMAITLGIIMLTVSWAPPQSRTVSGNLVDADCKADDATAECPLNPTTKAFGVQTPEGQYIKLDSGGNARAHVALRRLLKKKGIDVNRAGVIKATVTGTIDGGTVQVDALELY
jgi:hypothetical protein